MELFLAELSWLVLTYVIGSLPFGLIIARTTANLDPRLHGSGNTGATNIARLCGTSYGVLTFVLDAAKGFFPVLIGTAISGSAVFITLTGLAALLGHMYSVFLDRRGGKGVATTIGIFLALVPGCLLVSLALGLLLIWATGFVSLGSLVLVTALPVFILLSGTFSLLVLSLAVLVLVYWKHRDNILRLARGEEHPWKKDQFAQRS
jgi:glycerol-3-phosphate acyltransferase PlsY